MESRIHGIIIVKTEENRQGIIAPNKAKYNPTIKVTRKKYRWILHAEEDERFVKRRFCFHFIKPTKLNPKMKKKASKKTEITKAQ